VAYFEPASGPHQLAPDATLTDGVLATMVTGRGHNTRTPGSFLEAAGDTTRERSLSEQERGTLLDAEVSIRCRTR
jgi:hypothetical protein